LDWLSVKLLDSMTVGGHYSNPQGERAMEQSRLPSTGPAHMTAHASHRAQERKVGSEGLRAALLFGDRFVQSDGTVLHLVTRRACARLSRDLGLRPGYVHDALYRVYAVVARSGAIVTTGRRFEGAHIYRS
jgi:hypothetical protein